MYSVVRILLPASKARYKQPEILVESEKFMLPIQGIAVNGSVNSFKISSGLKVVYHLYSKLGKVLFYLHHKAHSLEDLFKLGLDELFG